METGIVKWFNVDRGYGFITPERGGKDLFAHANDVLPSGTALHENQRVQFSVTEGRKGLQASNISAVA